MKYFYAFLIFFSIYGVSSQNLHDEANAASILIESNSVDGWTGSSNITASDVNPYSGNYSIVSTRTAANGRDMSYTFSAVIGEQYNISIWAREGDSGYDPAFANWTGLNGFQTTRINGNNWVEHNWTVTATSSNPIIRIYATPSSGGQTGNQVFIDNVSIQLVGTGDSTPPSIPTGLSLANITSTSLDLSWVASTDNIGVTDYEVFQDGVSLGLTGGLLTRSISGLTGSTAYGFTVESIDGSGNRSGLSTALTVTTLASTDTTIPSIPTGLSSANITSTSLDLSWVASTDNIGVTDYEVFQDGVSLGLTGGLLTRSISGLTGSTAYGFTVESIDGSGNRSGLSTALTVTTLVATDTTVPSIPTGLSSANITSTSLDLSWVASTDNIGVTDYEVFQDGVSLGLTGGLLTRSISGLTGSTAYGFTVESIDGSGNRSGLSTALTVTTLVATDTTVPSIPTGLSSANITSTSLDLSWVASTDNIGVTDYEVFQDGVSLGLTGGLLTRSISGLTGSTAYGFTVESIDGSGNRSGLSTALTVTTLVATDTTVPSIPTGLSSANITSTSLDLDWIASTDNVGVTDYEVFQDGVSVGLTGGLLTQSITGLSGSTAYAFTVQSIDGSGNRSASSAALTVTTLAASDVTAPSIPTGLSSANMTSTSLDLDWIASTDNVGVTDYEVFQDGVSVGLTGGLLTQSITGLSGSTAYAFTVQSIDGSGNRSASSAALTVTTLAASDVTAPSIPTGLSSANITSTSLDLSWVASTDNIGVTDYEVFQDGVSLGLTGGLLTRSISGLTGSTVYGFTVESIDGSGNRSGLSTALTVTTLVPTETELHYTEQNANLESVDWIARDLFAFRNLGIGTTNTQGYRLAVAGNIIAEEIKVQLQTAWPDYVFKTDYELPLLEDVEKHIKEKGYLPNVPSEKEVKANGIKLGEMNAVLLEKIEELTLYILQQEKRINALEVAVKKLNE
ncbi:fibronectin type III domain-containing protein [Formosa sp. PL04]|uniref:fibronectin type III domain-containing protein n=1 Tax=Formosa sp. PL04 TaxID=3081755 RepID=UPI00298192DF|nr:hypothetical protein [Formosa sp. PL04]MDW5287518.1 hypothetical protein [Formosa sp. PL04]